MILNYIKTNFLAVLAILFFLWICFAPSSCGNPLKNGKSGPDTIHDKTNTVYVQQPPVQIPVYMPTQTGSQQPIIIPPAYQPSTDQTVLIKQYQELVNKFLTINNYKDSITLKDTSGHRVGVVNLDDNISQNQIISRKPNYQLFLPYTTRTITIKEPSVNQVYVGAGITGNTVAPLNGADLSVLFKNKKDRIFGVGAGVGVVNGIFQPQFNLHTYWKIHLGK